MSSRLYVYDLPDSHYTLVRGRLRDWLTAQRIPALNSPRLRGWQVRTERVPDLLAKAEADGFEVRLKGVLQ